jgi:hypothetical protein
VDFDAIEELAASATPETVAVVKLQVDTRKWALAKKLPKKYGDRITQNHEGSVQVSAVERTIVKAPDSDS